LGIAKKVGNEIELRVHPVLIPEDKMIAKVDGVMNGISVVGDKVGETMYYGAGAGGDATASAVVANIIDIARKGKGSPMLGFEKQPGEKITLMPKENIQTKYYLRLEVADKSGTLAKVATIFGNNSISIENMMQKPLKDSKANLLLTTHTCVEKDILKAIKELENSGVVLTKPNMIRIED
ncbi:ACT domain-containing protein, partial [Aliarcobacter butzleri]